MYVSVLLIVSMLGLGQAQVPAQAQPPAAPEVQPAPAAGSPAAAPSAEQEETPAPPPTVDPDAIGVSVDRIQKLIARPSALNLTEQRQVFRVEVFGKNPTIEDILGPDFLRGPVPYATMTHQEFLNMVTPQDVQGYAAFSNKQGMMVAATSIALQWALQKAMDKYKQARNERAKAAAQKEVQEALDALRKARREAGLPDK
jgi:hypothetical protein